MALLITIICFHFAGKPMHSVPLLHVCSCCFVIKDSRATKAVKEGVPGEEKGRQVGGTER